MASSGALRAILPWLIIVTWSATRSTSSSKCDEKSTVRPSWAIVRMTAPRINAYKSLLRWLTDRANKE